MKVSEVRKLPKKRLFDLVVKLASQNKHLKLSLGRLQRATDKPVLLRHTGRDDDSVPPGWPERHGITIPRADGYHESKDAWVRVKNGVITAAGLRDQSILMIMISLGKLDDGAEHHGSLYKDWRAAFMSQVDPGKSGGKGSDNPEGWSKEDRYSKLIHRLEKDAIEAMDCIVASRPKARHLAAFHAHQEEFAQAFLRIVAAMQDINRQAREAQGA